VTDSKYWDQFAATDPLWAVLSFPEKRGGRWSLQEFMKTGEREVSLLFHQLAELQLPLPTTRALDFGCGVGRVSQALARRIDRVLGADISPLMIDLARRLNHYPDRAEYVCTAETGLEALPAASFDCIYSNIVLQHVEPGMSEGYLRQFFRLLAPRGLLVVQLPSHRDVTTAAEITAMPDDAYQASLAFAVPPPTVVAAGSAFKILLNVRNESSRVWSQPESGPLAAGNHWLDAGGELMLKQDDGRAPLLQRVPPGLMWPVMMQIHAPAEPGSYVGEIDLVHEGVSWYGDKGSPTLRFTIDVRQSAASSNGKPAMMQEYAIPEYPAEVLPAAQSLPPSSGEFPMHGVPRDRVMDIIRGHGATLAYLEEDRRAGPEWVGYRYFIVA
jgi:SAM-dependent methyltransferase